MDIISYPCSTLGQRTPCTRKEHNEINGWVPLNIWKMLIIIILNVFQAPYRYIQTSYNFAILIWCRLLTSCLAYCLRWYWFDKDVLHYDMMTWKRFPHYWHFVRGLHRLSVDSLHKAHKGPVVHRSDAIFDVGLNKSLNKQSTGWSLRYSDTHLTSV